MTKAEMIYPKIGIKPKQFTDTHEERCYPLTVVCDLMDEWANQELTAEREKAAKLVNSLEMALQILEENQKERHPFSIRMIRQSLTEYKKQGI